MFEEVEDYGDDFTGGMLTESEAAKIPQEEVVQPEDTPVVEEVVETPEAAENPGEKPGEPEAEESQETPSGNLFDDFEEEAIVEVPEIVKELGFESVESLKTALAKPSEVVQESKATYANDDVAKYVERINAIAESGGDWRKAENVERQIAERTQELSNYDKNLEILKGMRSNGNVQEHKEFLKLKYQQQDGLSGGALDAVVDMLDELDDKQVIARSVEASISWANSIEAKKTSLAGEVATLKSSQDEMVNAAQASAAAARNALQGAFDSFEDAHSSKFTDRVRKSANAVVNSKPTQVTIPSAVANLLFFNENGEFDAGKMVQTLAMAMNGSKKIEYLQKKAQLDAFKATPDAKPRGASTKMENDTVNGDDFSGTIENSRTGMTGLVFNN